jgi:hypothetical protein
MCQLVAMTISKSCLLLFAALPPTFAVLLRGNDEAAPNDLDAAVNIVKGSARSMGMEVRD